MSNISIPGVSSRFNTEKMVEDLVNAERVNLTRLENRVSEFEKQKSIWQDVTRQLSNLQSVARSMYSFENPFNDRIANSSNESVLTAVADRTASQGTSEVTVLQLATADRFSSRSLGRDETIPQEVYAFNVGDQRVSVRFRGGSIREFAEAVSRVNPDLLRASIINDRPGSSILVLEAMRQGEENRLQFSNDAANKLALDLGLIQVADDAGIQARLDPASLGVSSGAKVDGQAVTVSPQSRVVVPFDTGKPQSSGMVLEYRVRVADTGVQSSGPSGPPTGIILEPGSRASLGDIVIPDKISTAPDTGFQPPAPPARVDVADILSVEGPSASFKLPQASPSDEFVTVQVPLSELGGQVSRLVIDNRNTNRTVTLDGIRIYDPSARDGYAPANALSTARNARLSIHGIEVERPSNTIDDLIPGVTLTLRGRSESPVTIEITPDREQVKDKLIEFVGSYNQVIRDINILVRNQPEIVDEITYFTDEEREKAMERLGAFQGNSTLNNLRQRLQTIIVSPYETRLGRDLSLLAQIGISTNAGSSTGAGLSQSRLRGYLEINESQLDRALEQNFLAVKDLFGTDTDNDLLVDKGVAFQLETFLRPFTQTGGLLTVNTQTLDRQITSTQGDITDYQRYLEQYEQRMRLQFGQMESAINSLEAQSRDIQGLNPQNGSNR